MRYFRPCLDKGNFVTRKQWIQSFRFIVLLDMQQDKVPAKLETEPGMTLEMEIKSALRMLAFFAGP